MPACGGSTTPLNTKVLRFEACHACNRALRYTIPGMHYEPPSVGNDDRQPTPRKGQMIFNAIPIARTCPRVRHQTKTPKQPKARVSQRSVRSRFGLGHRRFFQFKLRGSHPTRPTIRSTTSSEPIQAPQLGSFIGTMGEDPDQLGARGDASKRGLEHCKDSLTVFVFLPLPTPTAQPSSGRTESYSSSRLAVLVSSAVPRPKQRTQHTLTLPVPRLYQHHPVTAMALVCKGADVH